MKKCKECGTAISGGAYNTPLGLFCCKCWEKKPQETKDNAFKKSHEDLALLAHLYGFK
jgi:hypothetical protein